MKKILTYILIAAALAGCSDRGPDVSGVETTDYEMGFQVCVVGINSVRSRVEGEGAHTATTVPNSLTPLYLTAYYTDKLNERSFYLRDYPITRRSVTDLGQTYLLEGWYWPLQGKMSFLSYFCTKFSVQPTIDEITVDIEGNTMARMMVDASNLVGKDDFIYLSQESDCPQPNPMTLQFKHGLAWLSVRMYAEVMSDNGVTADDTKTAELISHIKVHKVVIEDCSRRGFATVVAGSEINWKTYDDRDPENIISYTNDQVYYSTGDKTNMYEYEWVEQADASAFSPTNNLTLLSTPHFLGQYKNLSQVPGAQGLLIVPQNKTAITIDYTVRDSNNQNIHKVERYELRDNSLTWRAGYHYIYDIVFRNYDDIATNFDLLETWEGVEVVAGNPCYVNSLGTLGPGGSNTIGIEPIHSGGSALGNEMDYPEGGRVF